MVPKKLSEAYTSLLHFRPTKPTLVIRSSKSGSDSCILNKDEHDWFNDMMAFGMLTERLAAELDRLPIASKLVTSSLVSFLSATARNTPFGNALVELNSYICGLSASKTSSRMPRNPLGPPQPPSPVSARIDEWVNKQIENTLCPSIDIRIAYALKHQHRLLPTTDCLLAAEFPPHDLAALGGEAKVTFSHALSPLRRLCAHGNAYAEIFQGNKAFDAYRLEAKKLADALSSVFYCGCFVISSWMKSISPDYTLLTARDRGDPFALLGGRWLFTDVAFEVQRAATAIHDAIAESRDCISLSAANVAPQESAAKESSSWWHNEDFSVVSYNGKRYCFTRRQAVCVAFLWKAKDSPAGGEKVSRIKNELKRHDYQEPESVPQIFRNSNGATNPAFNEIVYRQGPLYVVGPPREVDPERQAP